MKDRQIEIKLTVESAEVTEAWLKLEIFPLESEAVYIVKRDTDFVFNGKLDKSDTLLHDKNLLPAHDYNYSAYAVLNGKTGKIVKASLTTMPTTSHSFIWDIDTLGNYGSYLNDVWIVDENDIWVVGQIIMPDPDSSFNGTGRETFNVAHWNGEEWELMRIINSAPLYSIWYFNEDDIWVATFGLPIHWDGNKWTSYHLWNMGVLDDNDGGVEHIWASSPSDIYFVGRKGSIVHYDGQNFTKMESGTDLDLVDISGTENGEYVFVVGYEVYSNPHRHIVLQISKNQVTTFYYADDDSSGYLGFGQPQAVHVLQDIVYIKTWDGLWEYNWKTGESRLQSLPGSCSPDHIGVMDMDGPAPNDLFFVIGIGEFMHFNGCTWNFENWLHISRPTKLYRVSFKNDMAVMVGHYWAYQTGLAVRGYR